MDVFDRLSNKTVAQHDTSPTEASVGAQSVSVFAPTCVVAGMLASIAMLRGVSGLQWLNDAGVDAVVVDAGGTLARVMARGDADAVSIRPEPTT